MNEVTVAWGCDSPRSRYALDVLRSLLGTTARDAAPGERATIGYGTTDAVVLVPAGPQEGWDDPSPAVARIDELPVLHRPGEKPRPHAAGELGFDALYAAYAC